MMDNMISLKKYICYALYPYVTSKLYPCTCTCASYVKYHICIPMEHSFIHDKISYSHSLENYRNDLKYLSILEYNL